jgi:hypothetical protein
MIQTAKRSRPRWPFQRPTTAWLPTFTLPPALEAARRCAFEKNLHFP